MVVKMLMAKYPAISISINNALWYAGAQLSSKLQPCGVWCKEVLRQYPLYKLPVPSILKATLQQAQGAISYHQPHQHTARPGQSSPLIREAHATYNSTASLRHRRALADERNWQAVLLQQQQQLRARETQ